MEPTDEVVYLSLWALKQRMWTLELIGALLGPPDLLKKVSGCRWPLRGYDERRVQAAEATEQFKQAAAQERARRDEVMEWSTNRKAPLLASAREREIKVKVIERDSLERKCLRDPQFGIKRRTKIARVLNRWKVSYIRRKLTNESMLHASMRHKPGAREAYWIVRGRVLAAIAKAYPDLTDTCEQLSRERFERDE